MSSITHEVYGLKGYQLILNDFKEMKYANFKRNVGRSRVFEDDVSMGIAKRIATIFDKDHRNFSNMTSLPSHWYTMIFPEFTKQSELASDGHAENNTLFPKFENFRRMGVGFRMRLFGSLKVGVQAKKTSTIKSVELKNGNSGNFYLVTVSSLIESQGKIIVEEEFDTVFREPISGKKVEQQNRVREVQLSEAWRRDILISESLVFRYSAITWNAHRIHYDADYSREVEGYDGLVQNGGLTINLLLNEVREQNPMTISHASIKLLGPVRVGEKLSIFGSKLTDKKVFCWVTNSFGKLCCSGEIEFEK